MTKLDILVRQTVWIYFLVLVFRPVPKVDDGQFAQRSYQSTVLSIVLKLLSSRRLVQAVNVAAIVELLEEIYVDELSGLSLFGSWVSNRQLTQDRLDAFQSRVGLASNLIDVEIISLFDDFRIGGSKVLA